MVFSLSTKFVFIGIFIAFANGQEACSKKRDKFFQCMRNLHTSTEAKTVKEKNRVVGQQCGIAQINVECWLKKDACQNEAEQSVESSSAKAEASASDDHCWKTVEQNSGGSSHSAFPRRSPPLSGQPGPGQNAGPDPTSPAECIPPYNPRIAACTVNLLRADQQFIVSNEKMRQKAKECQDLWPQECKPQNPVLASCLQKAYEKLGDLTAEKYKTCMQRNGYALPENLPSSSRQIFPL